MNEEGKFFYSHTKSYILFLLLCVALIPLFEKYADYSRSEFADFVLSEHLPMFCFCAFFCLFVYFAVCAFSYAVCFVVHLAERLCFLCLNRKPIRIYNGNDLTAEPDHNALMKEKIEFFIMLVCGVFGLIIVFYGVAEGLLL